MPFKATRSPLVFIPHRANHDYTDAKSFGELVFLTEGEQNRFKLNQLYTELGKKMLNARPDDYLMITGPTTVNIVASTLLVNRFGRVNFLIFDGFLGRYVSRPIDLRGIQDDRDATKARA